MRRIDLFLADYLSAAMRQGRAASAALVAEAARAYKTACGLESLRDSGRVYSVEIDWPIDSPEFIANSRANL